MKNDIFSVYHPFVNFVYFALCIGITMFFMNPVMLCISLISVMIYGLTSDTGMLKTLKFIVPVVFFTSLLNPLFNHRGATILFYLPNDNPLTLESIIYGCISGIMLAAVLLWFMRLSNVFISDKFVYLFGRIVPSLALLLSMTLRLVPKFERQLREINDAQRSLGNDVTKGNLLDRLKTAFAIFSVLITKSLEDSIDTADSMKSRGYGTRKRTAFSIYKWKSADTLALSYLILLGMIVVTCSVTGNVQWEYFPEIKGNPASPTSVIMYISFSGICITPIYLNVKETLKWHRSN